MCNKDVKNYYCFVHRATEVILCEAVGLGKYLCILLPVRFGQVT